MNLIEEMEKEQIAKLTAEKSFPDFAPGDTVKVKIKVVEGTSERIQAYEGVCIARRNRGINSSFTVRKISYGEGVERIFPLYSPMIASIEVVRRGAVRRAKLYYLRGLRGKSARIRPKREERRTTLETVAGAPPELEALKASEVEKIEAAEGEKPEAPKAKKAKKAKKKKTPKAKKKETPKARKKAKKVMRPSGRRRP